MGSCPTRLRMFPSPRLNRTSVWIHWLTVPHQGKPKDLGNATTAWCRLHQPSSLGHQAKIQVKVGLVSQEVTKSMSRFDTKMKGKKVVEVTCSMHRSSLHGKQPGLMWTAVALHFAAPSGHSLHCCQLVLFSTVTPACGKPGAPSRFLLFSWLLPGLGLRASQMWNQDCRFYNPLHLQWQDLQKLGRSRSCRDKPDTMTHGLVAIWPLPTSSTSLLSTYEHLFFIYFTKLHCCWISRLLFRWPPSCALLLVVPWTSAWGPTPEAQFMPFSCETVW